MNLKALSLIESSCAVGRSSNGRLLSTKASLPARQALRIMKLTTFLLLVAALQVSAEGNSQTITLAFKNAPLEKVFSEIERQTGFSFVYADVQLAKTRAVDLALTDIPLETALSLLFKDQPLTYTIERKYVVVKNKVEAPAQVNIPLLITVRGHITNENGEPVIASVVVKGTKAGTTSNANGDFQLADVDEKATLLITGVSIEPQEIQINSRQTINVTVKNKTKEEEEVIVAYGKTTERANVGAVTVVKGDLLRDLPSSSIDKSLQGYVPGLLVTSGTGQPGGGLSNFVLRGIATSASAENGSTLRNPLIVIDGIPVTQDAQQLRLNSGSADVPIHNPMAQLNPSDIETISVLKDAAAIALYGSQASNGVILINTKRGKVGKTRFSFRNNTFLQQRLKGKIELLGQEEYMELLYETYRNSTPGITDAAILNDLKSKFPTRADGSLYPFEDLTKQIYTNSAITTTNELSMSGGNERYNYYLSLEWTKNNGTYRRTSFDRKSIRYNFENKATDWLKIAMNNTLSYNQQRYASVEASDSYGFINASAPLNPVYLESGDYLLNYTIPYEANNPVAAIDYNANRNTSYRGLSTLSAELNFLKHFRFTSVVGVDFQLTEAKEKRDPRLFDYIYSVTGIGRITEGQFRSANLISTNKLSYARSFNNNHSFNVLIAQEARVLSGKTVIAEGRGIRFITNDQIDNTVTRTSSGNFFKQTLLSYFGQAGYDFKRKYFLSASIRLDADSKFGSDQRFGTYWSTGAGWIVSDEQFMKQTGRWLNYLKLRGSVGAAGNSGAINRYTKYSQLSNAIYQNSIAIFPQSQPYNPDIKWEKTINWDAGIEAKFLNQRIAVTVDVYRRKTSDLIYLTEGISLNSGYGNVLGNVGDMLNKGIETSFSLALIKTKDFTWNINANWSTNQNKLVKANIKFAQSGIIVNEEGRDFNSYYMPVWAGVDPFTGLGMWIDSTGKQNTNYSAAGKQFVGKPQPDGFGMVSHTFTFRNISLSAQFYYQYGYQIFINNISLVNDGARPYSIQGKEALDRWQKPGDIASNPKRYFTNFTSFLQSTRNLYNGDHIRLQNIALSYRFPVNLINRIGINGLLIHAQAHNVAIWTNAKGDDVANANISGLTGNGYPNSKTYSFGITVDF